MSEAENLKDEILRLKQKAKTTIDKINETEKKILITIYLSNEPLNSKQILKKLKINKSTLSRILKKPDGINNLIEEVTGRERSKEYKLNLMNSLSNEFQIL